MSPGTLLSPQKDKSGDQLNIAPLLILVLQSREDFHLVFLEQKAKQGLKQPAVISS